MSSKPLKIFSASAGSGKTYNLVLMYLRIILSDQLEPVYFSRIIAMTFTNKAAIEMKQRIIEALNTLGNFDAQNPKSLAYREAISVNLKLSPEEITKRAKLCLKQILHHYEDFNVLTIDKFNLRLIRSFSKDLNINTDFQTSTNEKEVLSEIVDLLLDEINQPNFQYLTEVALKYAKENAEDEARWDFKKEVKSLAEQLINEKNFELIQFLVSQDFSIQRYEKLKKELQEEKKGLMEQAETLHRLFFSYDTSNFPEGNRAISAFEKLKVEKQVLGAENSCFFSKAILKAFEEDPKSKAFPDDIKQAGIAFVNYYEQHRKSYLKLNEFRKNYFNIALLQMIAKELENFKKTDNIVLISEFNKLISELLKNEEAPYIYERIGNRYQHYLLDEFQDTSRLQWTNLLPLIHDSLGNSFENLIVGDPKQSIYRFKNGLAEQFVALPRIYNPEKDVQIAQKSAYFEAMGEVKSLTQNWRSKREIVEFNNLFFNTFKYEYTNLLGTFYQDVEQEFNPNNSGGYVYIETSKQDKKTNNLSSDEITDSENEAIDDLSYLLTWIKSCIADNYDCGDICLLGNTAKQCNLWATFLTNHGYKVVSADSLLLGSDKWVQFIMLYLKWRVNPSSELEAKRFAEAYFTLKGEDSFAASKRYWKTIPTEKGFFTLFDSNQFIVSQFGSEDNFFFHYENLYQLIQHFYQLVEFNELENPFLHQFSDYVFQFDQARGPEVKLFIETFENEGCKTAVQIPENKDAIKILTAHKSKGLEFPIVIIPHLNWNLLMPGSKYLIRDGEFLYYRGISKSSKIDTIANYYEEEYSKALLDKINLIYVAFTRPKERLYVKNVLARRTSDLNFEIIVDKIIQNLPNLKQVNEKLIYEYGSCIPKKITDKGEKIQASFHPLNIGDKLWFPDISIQDRDHLQQDDISEQQRYGNQLHYLLSQVESVDKLDSIINESLLNGQVEQLFEADLRDEMLAILNLDNYKILLNNSTEILREQAIVVSENETKRPDLIIKKENETLVLDYKTGMPNGKYIKQLKNYCETLREMNFPNVKGYVFYTGSKQLEEIE
jgi:ATP-dependent exoDNAse (exonuclease V) beta subunit